VEGAQLLIQIVAMLIVLIALVYLANSALSLLPGPGGEPLTAAAHAGLGLRPAGVDRRRALGGGAGGWRPSRTKTILNEFVAYIDLAKLPPEVMGERSKLLMTYALCGFANFGSLGILIGGMGAMVPDGAGRS